MTRPLVSKALRAAFVHTAAFSSAVPRGGSSDALIKKAELHNLYQRVREAASKFKSPMFRDYFIRRADEDFRDMQEKLLSVSAEEIEQFKKLMEDHCALLHRQSTVANLYHTDRIAYLK
ncbi:hypothetical protein TGPRC2_254800 [Toxoplasma gondii TgCatPRC2]|uniref:Uncharacterized protein n=13 Tax=Toxoplasma gondii TaxID=5811 RepID=S7UM84_TOXGG|nr:hypothetical protein TGME49_254800 [Toxoplasma gondii ME49]EPR59121.1 hypothetical protein TGGT1_254800 [Toxoplasma gondii GT1]KAF4645248.1 hypothetical protein TGRH88_003520 [Toxoplasma gondii]KFG46653.1 hypothetical protein TGP89_254800 [Toxoplasma gondii p89]KFG53077.1 hypothetical protein TGFOU_254800 [Toxoplasma gondii FOU]KFG59931.1 hypothetical protein TGRUB_254800 [Toxoplasma gondii RUB]KFH06748.1 hypothetical protein TGVAND_254800 [Toxoplasma gondii VAND]KFH15078.1 hypothetical p|eukprot:XP_002369534.1 hypothetical protein TGME49_254800 [Toxoplasma gondii ME49]